MTGALHDTIRAKIEGEPVDSPDRKNRAGATTETTADKLAKEAELMTVDQRDAATEAIKWLADRCNGARDWDGAGFSKLDTMIGKDLAGRPYLSKKQCALANKIVRKYAKTQLPEAIAERLFNPKEAA